jgi:dihydroorotase
MTSSDRLVMRRPDDWHVHLRDGAMLRAVLPATARTFARAVVMPNLRPPVTSVDEAIAYRSRILAALSEGVSFEPLMTAYLTDAIDPGELDRGFRQRVFSAAKLYPANATTNSAAGVSDLSKISVVLEHMEAIDMPLLIHGEVTDPDVDVFDREALFIQRHLMPLRERHPRLRIILEHITTEEAVIYIREAYQGGDERIAATITPHHLHLNRNAMFVGGLRSDFYCLPVVKRECHRRALVRAATSGLPCFFLGTDSAPHPRSGKESACGCAGIFNALHALESYAAVFEEEGALDHLEGFASEHGPRFYGLPLNTDTVSLVRGDQLIPSRLLPPQAALSGDDSLPEAEWPLLFHAGETLAWRVEMSGQCAGN